MAEPITRIQIISAVREEFSKDQTRTCAEAWQSLYAKFGEVRVEHAVEQYAAECASELADVLHNRPTHFPDYKGDQTAIKWPKGDIIARVENVFLIRQRKGVFATVYGLEVKVEMPRQEAAHDFGYCVMHQAQCQGLI